ncbi:hypothetical protein B5F87_19825 [Eubacterium sp. An3]|nr:hypothetical protein B5F87_19825 [Eubacterium sp. An3]
MRQSVFYPYYPSNISKRQGYGQKKKRRKARRKERRSSLRSWGIYPCWSYVKKKYKLNMPF